MCLEPREPVPDETSGLETVIEFLDDLSAAMVNARIYRPDHPRVQASIDGAVGFLRQLPVGLAERSLRLSVVDDLIVFGSQPLLGASVTASRLVRALDMLGSGGVEIDRTAPAADLETLVMRLATLRGDGDWSAINDDLELAGHAGVRLLPPFVETRPGEVSFSGDMTAPVRFYQACIDLLQDVTVAVCHGGHIDFGPVRAQAEAVLRHLEQDNAPLINLARQDQYDAFTFGHSVRVAVLAMNFARSLFDDREFVLRIGVASLLHDCGKALVPFEILHSRKPLGADERREMNRHSQFGAEILLDHQEADPLSIASAFGHHRSCDGGGYPATVHEHHNHLVTEVVKICDVYEALTAARPYKRPMSPVRAYRVMISMAAHLDRSLLRQFIEVNGIHPVGQLIELSTGETARVIAQNDDLLQPLVQVVTDRDGNLLEPQHRRTVDVREAAADHDVKIVRAITDRVQLQASRS